MSKANREISIDTLARDAVEDNFESAQALKLPEIFSRYLLLIKEIESLEDRLALYKPMKRQFETVAIPSLLSQAGINSYQFGDKEYSIDRKIEASIPQSRAEEAYKILYDLGYANKCQWVKQLKIHPQTLLKIVRDLIDANGLTPEIQQAFGVHIEPRVKVSATALDK